MRIGIAIGVALLLVLTVFAYRGLRPSSLPEGIPRGIPKGVPIAAIKDGKLAPSIGLVRPLPGWLPLPDEGRVIGAGTYPPQPPYGVAAVVMLKLSDSDEAFVAAYKKRLGEKGFAMRRIPIQPNLIIDAPTAQYEADERQGGRTIYITMRGTYAARFAQLTFWDVPAPRL